LLGFNTRLPRGILAEVQEAAELVPKLG